MGLKEAKLPSVRMALMGHLYQPTPPLRRHSGRRKKTNIRTKGCGYADQKMTSGRGRAIALKNLTVSKRLLQAWDTYHFSIDWGGACNLFSFLRDYLLLTVVAEGDAIFFSGAAIYKILLPLKKTHHSCSGKKFKLNSVVT